MTAVECYLRVRNPPVRPSPRKANSTIERGNRRSGSGWLAGWVGYPLPMRSGAAFCPQAPKIEACVDLCTGSEPCEQLF